MKVLSLLVVVSFVIGCSTSPKETGREIAQEEMPPESYIDSSWVNRHNFSNRGSTCFFYIKKGDDLNVFANARVTFSKIELKKPLNALQYAYEINETPTSQSRPLQTARVVCTKREPSNPELSVRELVTILYNAQILSECALSC